MITPLIKALMQATGDTAMLDAIGEEQKVTEQDNKLDVSPETPNLDKILRLREALDRFTFTRSTFRVGDLVIPREDAPDFVRSDVPMKSGMPALVAETGNWGVGTGGTTLNLRLLVFMGGYILPALASAAFFELYTGEGSDL